MTFHEIFESILKPIKRKKKETDANKEGQSHDDADDEDDNDENDSTADDDGGENGEEKRGKKRKLMKDGKKLKFEGRRGMKKPKKGIHCYYRELLKVILFNDEVRTPPYNSQHV